MSSSRRITELVYRLTQRLSEMIWARSGMGSWFSGAEQSLANADPFNMVLQESVTAFAWGTVWNRPGLELKTRSMLNLAMLAALGREAELRLHLVGALNNGVTKMEIAEIFLQAAVYSGYPSAVSAFRTAREVFKERGI